MSASRSADSPWADSPWADSPWADSPWADSSWAGVLAETATRLGDLREAKWMIDEVAGGTPNERTLARLEDMVRRRLAGEPLQYVLGSWSFRSLDLMVDQRVLIPRPETEQVVEAALGLLRSSEKSEGRPAVAVDLGTGSGAIALSLAAEVPALRVWATDASPDALAVAGANLAGLAGFAATRVTFCLGDWYEALPPSLRGGVDLIVSNPPYISTGEMASLDRVVADFEPRSALDAGPLGTECISAVLAGAADWLAPGGAVVVEIAPHQSSTAIELASASGLASASVRDDLAGRPRVLVARR